MAYTQIWSTHPLAIVHWNGGTTIAIEGRSTIADLHSDKLNIMSPQKVLFYFLVGT